MLVICSKSSTISGYCSCYYRNFRILLSDTLSFTIFAIISGNLQSENCSILINANTVNATPGVSSSPDTLSYHKNTTIEIRKGVTHISIYETASTTDTFLTYKISFSLTSFTLLNNGISQPYSFIIFILENSSVL